MRCAKSTLNFVQIRLANKQNCCANIELNAWFNWRASAQVLSNAQQPTSPLYIIFVCYRGYFSTCFRAFSECIEYRANVRIARVFFFILFPTIICNNLAVNFFYFNGIHWNSCFCANQTKWKYKCSNIELYFAT